MTIARTIICQSRAAKLPATAAGRDSRAITIMMPTTRTNSTTARAVTHSNNR